MWFGKQATPRKLGQGSWQGSWQDIGGRLEEILAGFCGAVAPMAGNEAELRRKFWRAIKREAANIPFVEDALTAHYCAFDRRTPFYVKAALIGAVVYFIVPDDLIPNSIPVFGYLDDAAVLAGAMKIFRRISSPSIAKRRGARLSGCASNSRHGPNRITSLTGLWA